jgi:hypothetical protein
MCWNRITGPSNAGCVQASIFVSFWGAWRTIAGYEAIHMIRKGQACWSAAGAKVGLLHHFILVCSLRRAKFPIIYRDLRLDYKVATHPNSKPNHEPEPAPVDPLAEYRAAADRLRHAQHALAGLREAEARHGNKKQNHEPRLRSRRPSPSTGALRNGCAIISTREKVKFGSILSESDSPKSGARVIVLAGEELWWRI